MHRLRTRIADAIPELRSTHKTFLDSGTRTDGEFVAQAHKHSHVTHTHPHNQHEQQKSVVATTPSEAIKRTSFPWPPSPREGPGESETVMGGGHHPSQSEASTKLQQSTRKNESGGRWEGEGARGARGRWRGANHKAAASSPVASARYAPPPPPPPWLLLRRRPQRRSTGGMPAPRRRGEVRRSREGAAPSRSAAAAAGERGRTGGAEARRAMELRGPHVGHPARAVSFSRITGSTTRQSPSILSPFENHERLVSNWAWSFHFESGP
jgi:hypothetical protein